MNKPIQSLIAELVAIAKERGLTQGQLAEQAGMTGVGLSKAKHRGDIRASLLEAMANQLDLKLALVPRATREKAAEAIKAGTFLRPPRDPGDPQE